MKKKTYIIFILLCFLVGIIFPNIWRTLHQKKQIKLYKIELKNGRVLEGQILNETEKGYNIALLGGRGEYFDFKSELFIDKDKISRITLKQ